MENFVELKNRLILGSVFFSILFIGAFYLVFIFMRSVVERRHVFRSFFVLSSVISAVLSPSISIFFEHIHFTQFAVLLVSLIVSGSTLFKPKRSVVRCSIFAAEAVRLTKTHAAFILIVPIFLFVFLCEIKDQWDVYEADGPYYGHFAKNILRYNLSYTFLLRTHGTGDTPVPVSADTHNLRHPPGYILYVTGWYLLFGSNLSTVCFRLLPISSNFVFILLLYLFILKKTNSRTIATCSTLFFILIPIASTFGNKIHQLSIVHLVLILIFTTYDNFLNGSKTACRFLYLLCFISLLIDWYLFILWPIIWLHYGAVYLRNKGRFHIRFMYVLPAICVATCGLIFGQILLGAGNLDNFRYIFHLRFQAEYVKRFSMENFNNTLVLFLMRDYTKIVTQMGMIWPFIFVFRLIRKEADRLDVLTFLLFTYALINIYLFQKIFIHYFEVIHFLLYAVLACTLIINYIYQRLPSFGVVKSILFLVFIPMVMLSDTVSGIRNYRERHSYSYTDGCAEAVEYVKARLRKDEVVVVNKLVNIYSSEGHIITNKTVLCKDMKCYKKTAEEHNVAYVILFEKPFDGSFNKQILKKGRVSIFHDQVAVVELKQRSSLVYEPSSKEVKRVTEGTTPILLTNELELVGHTLPKKVTIKNARPYRDYFYSLNQDKYPEDKWPELMIEYYYKRTAIKDKSPSVDKEEKESLSKNKPQLSTKIRRPDGTTVKQKPHPLSSSFFSADMWPINKVIRESVSILLDNELVPGEYIVFLSTQGTEFEIGKFYMGHDEGDMAKTAASSAPKNKMDFALTKSLSLVGADIERFKVNAGDKVRIHTYYQRNKKGQDAIPPTLYIRNIYESDLKQNVEVDPSPFLIKGKIYHYETEMQIPPFAQAGIKQIDLMVADKVVTLGNIVVQSERSRQNMVVETTIDKTLSANRGGNKKETSSIQVNKGDIQIEYFMKNDDAVVLMIEAKYGPLPTGYMVIADTKAISHNRTTLQVITSDILEKTFLSSSIYHRTISIPDSLVNKGENHVIIKPFVVEKTNVRYPGWRNLFLKLFVPVMEWLLLQKVQPDLPELTYIAIDK